MPRKSWKKGRKGKSLMSESKTMNNIGKIKKLPNRSLLIKDIKSAKEAARNKGLAKLGDEIINMCFSLARSLHTMECTGEKVSEIGRASCRERV